MTISLLRPLFLLLLPAIALLWFRPRRPSDRVQAILRSLVFAALILGLAHPVWLTVDAQTYHVFVVDRSASISAAQQQKQRDAVAAVRQSAGAHASLVAIGEPADKGAAPIDTRTFSTVVQVNDPRSTSPIGLALADAARQVPEGARGIIHLFTDGLSTDRRWAPDVQQIISRGITVDAYDMGYNEHDVHPAGLTSKGLLRVGQTARIDVDVAGIARGMRVRLLDATGGELSTSGPIDSDGQATVPMTFEPRDAGFLQVTAEVVAGDDADRSNNKLSQWFAVQDPLRVLYLGDRVQGAVPRLRTLLGRGFDVQDASDQSLSGSVDLSGYDLVMLDDRPASLVPEAFQQRLEQAVGHEGLGLVISGGRSSFGTGGYDGTPIADIAPVEFVQRTEKRDPSAALAIIIDTSGSMQGTRIELAKQVARLAVRRLKSHDRIGIVEFYGNKHWALPMQSAANKIAIDRAIGRMQAIGGTVMMPAIEEAYYGLKNVDTRYKHMLIITDAGVESADWESMLRQVAKDGINVSTVLVGAQAHNQLLIDLASWGKGRFYSVSDRYSLPEIILKQPSTMKLPAYKTGTFSVDTRGGEGWWSDIDRRSLPALDGYVETTTRDGAEELMEVNGTADPLLATWRYGLGRVTALMTEPVGEGTGGWANWRDYGRLLARVFSRTAADTRVFEYSTRRTDHELDVTAVRTSRETTWVPTASLLDDAGEQTKPLPFREVAPGRFAATLAIDPSSSVRVMASAVGSPDDGAPGLQARGSAPAPTRETTRVMSTSLDDVSPETQVDPVHGLDLEALAKATGGAYLEPAGFASGHFERASVNDNAPFDRSGSLSATRLWPGLFLIALLLYIAEIIWRRWPGSLVRQARGI
jgi:Ca-activated chloride channel family protein